MSVKEYSSLSLVHRIKYWKDKYKNMPNGWAVSNLIGEQYLSDASKINLSQKRKRGNNDKTNK